MRFWVLILTTILIATNSTSACNVPVFRFALERWQADLVEVVVFHSEQLTTQQMARIESIRSQSRTQGGTANLQVILRETAKLEDDDLRSVWNELSDELQQKSPVVVVRSRASRGDWIVVRSIPLEQLAGNELLESPVRREMARRLLQGDSVVWLVVPPPQEPLDQELVERLNSTLRNVAQRIPIPEGIGLPGSELFSPIPLDIRFSVLGMDPVKMSDALLQDWFRRDRGRFHAADGTLVIPVFGRGRAFAVFPAEAITDSLIDELSIFLAGACSCQVKDMNPGFDLLLNVNWEQELFGDDVPDIPAPLRTQSSPNIEPTFVEIASGSPDSPGQRAAQEDISLENVSSTDSFSRRETVVSGVAGSRQIGSWLFALVAGVVLTVLLAWNRSRPAPGRS